MADFVCYGCGAEYPDTNEYVCEACGEPLSIQAPVTAVLPATPRSMWDFKSFLPIENDANIVSLGEGATPLIEAPRLAANCGFDRLLLKNEMANPTGSFKDRQVSAGISHAKEIGAETVAVVSSGNVACAASAYAARAGMKAVLLMHGHAAPQKIALAAAFGGTPICVDTPSAAAAFDLCLDACARFGWYHLSTAGMYNPFNVEGTKTIAYEIYQQTLPDLPEWIAAPVGGGGLLGGIWRGFLDLQRLGLIERPPRLCGVQASGCAPLKKALDQGVSFLDTLKDPWPKPKTIAGGIADDILFDGHTVMPAIRETRGAAAAIYDDAILEAQQELAKTEGLLCEPTSAVVIAALQLLPKASRVCCVLTGTGIKDFSAIQSRSKPPCTIEPTLAALEKALG